MIACETSGMTRKAFEELGHNAWSCDLLPSADNSPKHLVGDMFSIVPEHGPWDIIIAHPDCTYLTSSAEWAYGDGPYHQKVKPGTLVGAKRRAARKKAIQDVQIIISWYTRGLTKALVIENPKGALSTAIRKPDQIVQPYEFGDDASKGTCLWEYGVAPLVPTRRAKGRIVEWPRGSRKMVERWANQTDSGQNNLTPGKDRWQVRSKTYPGISNAFAAQWGGRTHWKPVVMAHELPQCECCDEPYCTQCDAHYADCTCVGPHQDDEYDYATFHGRLYAMKRFTL